MEPLNLMVSLSHFADPKPTLPSKQPRRLRKSRGRTGSECAAAGPAHARTSTTRRVLCWLRTATAR